LLLRNADVALGEDEVRGCSSRPAQQIKQSSARRNFADQTPSAAWMIGHGEAMSLSR
jgi:hypothetical protein